MRKLRRNRALQVVWFGSALMAISVFFEYSRMSPDYRFIVDPWALRGYELTQGWTMVAIAASIALLASLIGMGLVKESVTGAAIVAGVGLVIATIVTIIADPRDVVMSTIGVWGLAVIGASAATAAVVQFLPASVDGWARRGIIIVTALGSLWLLGQIVLGSLFESARPLWLIILVGFALMTGGVVLRKPRELAAYRFLINGAVIGFVVAVTIGGSVRTALTEAQVEAIGVAAELRDTQVTSGIMLTWVGGLLMILGAVAMWARRRDQLDAIGRAERQRAAARKSAEELGEEFQSRV